MNNLFPNFFLQISSKFKKKKNYGQNPQKVRFVTDKSQAKILAVKVSKPFKIFYSLVLITL